jgi:hypothetical protein
MAVLVDQSFENVDATGLPRWVKAPGLAQDICQHAQSYRYPFVLLSLATAAYATCRFDSGK